LDRLKGLHYTETIKFDGDRITLFPAKHVLGAAQVLVETDEGNRLLYSGDFLVPGTLPPEADVLVVEAAYGWPPLSRRCCRESAISYLVSLVKRLLSGGAIAIVAYQGKLQEAMNILVEGEVDVPFLAPADVYDVAQVYRKFGVEVGDCLSLGTPEANEVLKGPCVIFVSDPKEIPNDITRIYLDGRCTIPLHRLDSHRYVIGLSTHADSDGLLRYIEKSKARVVVIDGVRHAHASLLAQLVEKKLGIKCTVMPS
jgi:putative mRNA 3-end processing factor